MKRKRYPMILAASVDSPIMFSAPLEIEAAKAEGEKQGPRKFSMLAYSGGPMRLRGYPLPVVVDLSGMAGTKDAKPILRDHDDTRIVGHADKMEKANRLHVQGVVSGVGPDAQEVLATHDNGFPWQASIGARPEKLIEVPAGVKITANGREWTGPLILARKTTLYEISFVSRGADEGGTNVRIAASAAGSFNTEIFTMDFEKYIEAMGFKLADLTEAQQTALKAKYEAEIKASGKTQAGDIQASGGGATVVTVEVPKFDLEDIKAAYSEHLADIEAKAADYEDKIASGELAKIRAAGMKTARDLKAKALKERWPGSRLEVELIKATSAYEVELIRAERPKGPAIHSSSRDMTAPVIEAALCKSAGLPNIEKHFKEEVLEASDKSFRNMSLQECILIQAQANGYSGRAFRIHDGNLRDVMRHAFAADIRAGFSTVSLPGIFSNVANKFLLDGWNSVEQTWRSICRIRSVTDFKAVTSYRLTGDMKYEKVTNDGKLKHGKVGEESYTISADTFGKIFSLTRKDMINDDLGAFDTIRQKLGRGGALKLVEEFWKEFMDNAAFFTAARGNYLTGADTPLAIASLSAAVTAFRKLKDSDGNPLGVTPAILLTPPDNSVTADQIYQSTNLNTGGAATTAMVPDANVHRGKYQPQSSAYLSNSNFTGYSTLAWYLLASPADMPVMEGAFLNGQESPTIESAEADFATLGVDFRGYHDFGFAKKEYLGGIKIKGAA